MYRSTSDGYARQIDGTVTKARYGVSSGIRTRRKLSSPFRRNAQAAHLQ